MEMNEYTKSNYAINKVRKGIVYRNADGSILEVTFEKIAKDNPNFTMEDFEKLKRLSDELYHEEAKSDWNYHYHITSDLDENFISKWIASSSLEDDIMARDGKKIFNERFQEAVDTLLTPTQRRRFRMFAFKGLTYREIAKSENVDLRAVWESIEQSKKKIQKFFKNF
ncbi:MAG: sigma factor-like helix-turn-helix DNA-binding protein [Eubacterium sp.]